jgi:hypothetical protein
MDKLEHVYVSVMDPDPHGSAWIRINLAVLGPDPIGNADLDPNPEAWKWTKMYK